MQIKIIEKDGQNNQKKNNQKIVQVVFKDKIKQSQVIVKNGREILEIKIEKPEKIHRRKWIILIRFIIGMAKNFGFKNLQIDWEKLVGFKGLAGNDSNLGELFAEAVEMANYEFRKYKKKPKDGWDDVVKINLMVKKELVGNLRKEIKKGQIVGRQVNYARELSNISGSDLTPIKLVNEIKKAIKGTKIKMKVWGEAEMKKRKMNGVLAVGQGSGEKSQFIILEYTRGERSEKPVVLVGKGVTFDSGGIDTKPHPHALEMMMDMSGGASVLATLLAVEKMRVRRNIVVLIPAVENMPSGSSMRPGDVIEMSNRLNVEIGHTDAEGRLILADALVQAQKFKPAVIIDVATLTGAAVIALGTKATVLMTRDDDLANNIEELAEKTGDYVWRLPLWEEYENDIVGSRGDIANINTKAKPGEGSTITAGIFLWNFVKNFEKWVHLDIAPRMTADANEQLAKGAAGPAVRLLVEFIRRYK